MTGYFWISIILLAEVLIFISEIVLASSNKTNKAFRGNTTLENTGLIDLEKGFRINISISRVTLFLVYVILVVLYIDFSTDSVIEELTLYILGGILIYMVSLMNSKIFMFYSSHFVISAPFNPFRRDLIIHYDSIKEYEIYKALYNSFYLKLTLNDSRVLYIHFYGSYLPKNDLAIRYVLDKKTKLNKNHNS